MRENLLRLEKDGIAFYYPQGQIEPRSRKILKEMWKGFKFYLVLAALIIGLFLGLIAAEIYTTDKEWVNYWERVLDMLNSVPSRYFVIFVVVVILIIIGNHAIKRWFERSEIKQWNTGLWPLLQSNLGTKANQIEIFGLHGYRVIFIEEGRQRELKIEKIVKFIEKFHEVYQAELIAIVRASQMPSVAEQKKLAKKMLYSSELRE